MKKNNKNIKEIKMRNVIGYAKRFKDGIWSIEVDCPLCGKTHHHGGGDNELPKLGFRWADCGKGDYNINDLRKLNGSYFKESKMVKFLEEIKSNGTK